MKSYLLCLDRQYNVKLGDNPITIMNNLDIMLDNLVYLLQSYGIEDAEILETLKNDTTVEIEEVNND
jgi:hypothetical protein